MNAYRLIPESVDIHAIDVPESGTVIVGREHPANITFPENRRMSRRHAELGVTGKGVRVRDLDSKNGTYINGRRITESTMFPGDTLEIGGYHFVLHILSEASVSQRHDAPLCRYGSVAETRVMPISDTWVPLQDQKKTGLGEQAFRMLYRISSELIGAQQPHAFLQPVVDRVRRVIDAHRVILYLSNRRNELEPAAASVRFPSEENEEERAKISRTLLERIRRDKVAVLAMDTAEDSRFNKAESIIMAGIRSFVAAPLVAGGRVSGVIIAESKMAERYFDEFHLQIVGAIANLLAFALQRVRLREEMERENLIRRRLARYHSPEVVEAVIRRGGELVPEKRLATVWFCDIHGFTTYAETHTPEEVGALVNEFFEMAVEAVFRHGGTLDKYLGDGFMAVFGAPLQHDDDALRAVKAAIELHRRVLSRNTCCQSGYALRIRSGINTGELIAGDVGALIRKDYTVIGDTVNIAMRLQSEVAAVDQIILGPDTAKRVSGIIPVKSLGQVILRGRSTGTSVFRVCENDRDILL